MCSDYGVFFLYDLLMDISNFSNEILQFSKF